MNKLANILILLFSVTCFCSFLNNSPTLYSGEFRAIKTINYRDTVLTSIIYHPMSFLFNTPVASFSPANGENDGQIAFNNRPLYFLSTMRAYIDSADRKTDQGLNWNLSNSSSFPNFSYTCSGNYPTFGGISSIPKSICKSAGITIPLNNFGGADEIEFTIDDSKLHYLSPWYRKISATSTSITIPPTQLTGLCGQFVTMRITFIKTEEQTFSGTTFKFENRLTVNVPATLVP